MKTVIIRTAVLILALLCLTGIPYLIVGLWNRWTGRLGLVFYCYAGSPKFVESYGFPRLVRFFRWRPVPIGVLEQDGHWGLVLASPATERDFASPDNRAAFLRLQRRIGWIARVTGARQVHLAGILPGLVGADGPLPLAQTRPQVVRAVFQAVTEVSREHLPPDAKEIIVLGGAGFIGRALVRELTKAGWICQVIDPKAGQTELPLRLQGQPALLLDVARAGAITPYIDQLWPGLVVLNEVFPAPAPKLVSKLQAKSVSVFHLSGVAGRVLPPLPHGYEDAVPCCASRPTHGPPQVVIRRLSGTGHDAAVHPEPAVESAPSLQV